MVPLIFSETNSQAKKKALQIETIMEGITYAALRVHIDI